MARAKTQNHTSSPAGGLRYSDILNSNWPRFALPLYRAPPEMVFGYASLSGGFLKLSALFPVIFAISAYAVKSFVTSPISDQLLAALDVPLAKVPALAAVSLSALAFFSVVPTILGLSFYQAWDNSNPRAAKTREALKPFPAIGRIQSAHDNTLEFLAYMAPCLWSASTLGLDELLFAKLSALVLIARVAYLPLYWLDSNALRTTAFTIALFANLAIGFAPIFPELVLPLLSAAPEAAAP